MTRRSSRSHQGVRAGVRSGLTSLASSRNGGKAMRRGAGGVTRNRSHKAGRARPATSSQG